VTVIGCADVDGIDIVPGDQRLPVRLGALVSPLAGKSLGSLAISAANGLEYGAIGKVSEEIIDPFVTVGVGAPHEAIPHQSDIQWFFVAHIFSQLECLNAEGFQRPITARL